MVGADEPPLDPPDELLLEPVDPQPANRKIEKLRIRTVERRNNDIVWIGPSFFNQLGMQVLWTELHRRSLREWPLFPVIRESMT